jgi:lysine-N-methylase
MTTYWPDYCRDFKCIADKCLHTCCAGWVIGIDDRSLSRFEKDPEVASRIKDGCFVLKDDGRCPFLRDDNLCELILQHGDGYLCDICREHPRFYNTFDGHIEAGIGLVCEEACRLVLGCDKPFALVSDEGSLMELPEYVRTIFDDSKPLSEKLSLISGGRRANSKLRAEIFAEMEVMDPSWIELLMKIIGEPLTEEEEDNAVNANEKELTNFAAYLLYRYKGAGRFASEASYLLADLAYKGYDILDMARLFSGEVEYSDVNIEDALDTFG